MKTKLLTLTLCALSFGLCSQSFAAETTPTSSVSFLERVPSPYQVAQYSYHAANAAAWIAVLYVGYRAYNNDNLTNAVKTLYNLATSGDTVTAEERQRIREKKAKKYKDIEDTVNTVQTHTPILGTLNLRTESLLTRMETLQAATAHLATKEDVNSLRLGLIEVRKDIGKLTKMMNARFEEIKARDAAVVADAFNKNNH